MCTPRVIGNEAKVSRDSVHAWLAYYSCRSKGITLHNIRALNDISGVFTRGSVGSIISPSRVSLLMHRYV